MGEEIYHDAEKVAASGLAPEQKANKASNKSLG